MRDKRDAIISNALIPPDVRAAATIGAILTEMPRDADAECSYYYRGGRH